MYYPAVDRAVIHVESTLLHDLLSITIAQTIGQISADILENHATLKVPVLEGNHRHLSAFPKVVNYTIGYYLRENPDHRLRDYNEVRVERQRLLVVEFKCSVVLI